MADSIFLVHVMITPNKKNDLLQVKVFPKWINVGTKSVTKDYPSFFGLAVDPLRHLKLEAPRKWALWLTISCVCICTC